MLDWTGTNSNIRSYGTNAHHDTVWTASSTGTVSATLRYDPFGTLTTSTGSLPDFRFPGLLVRQRVLAQLGRHPLVRAIPRPVPVRGLAARRAERPAVTPSLRVRGWRADRALGSGWTLLVPRPLGRYSFPIG